MKKYKNKRTGDVVEQDGYNKYLYKHFDFNLSAAMVEDSCDWEEIIVDKAPEYTVLEYETIAGRATLRKNGTYFDSSYCRDDVTGATWEEAKKWIEEGENKIISIKRNSDRKIFTKNDRIDAYIFNNAQILGFKLEKHSPGKIWITTLYGNTPLHLVKLSEGLPLFYTEDNNIPVYEGDEYWYYHSDCSSGTIWHANADCVNKRLDDVKRFSTKKAAEEYIAKNKVLFVTEDGKGVKEGDGVFAVTSSFITMSYTNICGDYWKLTNKDSDGTKYFSSSKGAQEYIDNNKPMYSKQQIKDGFKKGRAINVNAFLEHLDK